MNYYRKYPGDFAGDTKHLSLTERGAYNELLDYCYGKDTIEIPKSASRLYQICGATKPHEKEAVRSVVAEFFPDGTNPRVRRQLPDELKIKEAAKDKAKKGWEARWGNSEGNSGDASSIASSIASSSHQAIPTRSHTPSPSPSPTPIPITNKEFKKQNSLLCAEHFANSAKSPAFNGSGIFMKTCKAGEEWEVPLVKIAEWEESYPDVDVKLTLLGIRQWLSDNPRKRKTSSGMVRFLGAWMMREQDKPDPRQYAKTKH